MSWTRREVSARRFSASQSIIAVCMGMGLAALCPGATTGYQYDELGRLRVVTHDNGNVTSYELDPAGNRTVVTESSGQAMPASISVPGTSLTGSYSISWTAGGTVTSYELYESASSNFSTQTRVYAGAGTSTSISGHGNGTYYYRVRGCNGSACTAYRTGPNGVLVTLPPGMPAGITVPQTNTTGSYTINWDAASGTLTGYELFESTAANFSGETSVYTGTARTKPFSGKPNGTYYYRVRACNGLACSAPRAGAGPIVVTIAPGAPSGISYPSTSNNGSYSIGWNAASGTVTAYKLYESTTSNFASQSLVYSGTTLTHAVSGKGNGTFYYRVNACNGAQCSAYNTGGAVVVTVPPGVPGAFGVPSGSNNGSIAITWGSASGTLTAYELWEATNSGFSGQTRVYNSTGTGTTLTGRSNGTYYYRLRACNGTSCSGYASGANQTVVTLPPGTPGTLLVPSTSTTGSYSISWGTASGNVTAYRLYEARNSSFSGESEIYASTGTSTSVSGRGNGTYYYRVRACNGSTSCGGYAAGGNQTTVTLPPSAPSSISAPPTSTTGNYPVSWGGSTGNVTTYELWEANNSGFSGATRVHNATNMVINLTGRQNGTYYYRARACNGTVCGGYATASPATVVSNVAPPAPTGLQKNLNSGCSWMATWTASPGATSYQIRDWSGNFNYTINAPATSTSYSFCGVQGYTGNSNDYRPKWLKACNATSCSAQTNFP